MDGQRGSAPHGCDPLNIRVLVADDQEIVRTGLSMILNAQPGIQVIDGFWLGLSKRSLQVA